MGEAPRKLRWTWFMWTEIAAYSAFGFGILNLFSAGLCESDCPENALGLGIFLLAASALLTGFAWWIARWLVLAGPPFGYAGTRKSLWIVFVTATLVFAPLVVLGWFGIANSDPLFAGAMLVIPVLLVAFRLLGLKRQKGAGISEPPGPEEADSHRT